MTIQIVSVGADGKLATQTGSLHDQAAAIASPVPSDDFDELITPGGDGESTAVATVSASITQATVEGSMLRLMQTNVGDLSNRWYGTEVGDGSGEVVVHEGRSESGELCKADFVVILGAHCADILKGEQRWLHEQLKACYAQDKPMQWLALQVFRKTNVPVTLAQIDSNSVDSLILVSSNRPILAQTIAQHASFEVAPEFKSLPWAGVSADDERPRAATPVKMDDKPIEGGHAFKPQASRVTEDKHEEPSAVQKCGEVGWKRWIGLSVFAAVAVTAAVVSKDRSVARSSFRQ